MSQSQVWFITGCSSGLGREIALAALAAGHRVIATARRCEDLRLLEGAFEGQLLSLMLDVTDIPAIERAVSVALEKMGRIDVLVNNAGYCYLAAVEEGVHGEIRRQFETNFFGAVKLTQLILPEMRARKSGFVVNISSGLGLVGAPSTGFYSATKFALEGLMESLAKEVAPLNIRVVLVEPGPIRTNFSGRSVVVEPDTIGDYVETAGIGKRIMCMSENSSAGDPAICGRIIVHAVNNPNLPLRLPLGEWVIGPAQEKWEAMLEEFGNWCDTAKSVVRANG